MQIYPVAGMISRGHIRNPAGYPADISGIWDDIQRSYPEYGWISGSRNRHPARIPYLKRPDIQFIPSTRGFCVRFEPMSASERWAPDLSFEPAHL